MIEADDSLNSESDEGVDTHTKPLNGTHPLPEPVPPVGPSPSPQPLSDNAGILRSASIISIGNIVSRILGLVRQTVILSTFGASLTSAYEVATPYPQQSI